MRYYTPEDLSAVLKIQPPTLRKYAQLLERHGYRFEKNKQGHRWYSDTDIIALQKLITYKRSGDMDLEAAAQAVFLWSKNGNVAARDTNDKAIHSDIERDNLPAEQDPAASISRDQLFQVLNNQQQTIERMAEKMELQHQQNTAIMAELKAIHSEMQALNAPKEEQTAAEPPPPAELPKSRGFWRWLSRK